MIYIQEELKEKQVDQWNFVHIFAFVGVVFFLIVGSFIKLQIIESSEHVLASSSNEVELSYRYPNRGVIYDRDGKILAENVASTNLYLQLRCFYNDDEVDEEAIKETITKIDRLIDGDWKLLNYSDTKEENIYDQILSRITQLEREHGFYARYNEILILSDLSNDDTIKIKSSIDKILGIKIVEGNKRHYPMGEPFAHILGYTGLLTAEDLTRVDYLGYDGFIALNGFQDIVGKLGVERVYDENLIGSKGLYAIETDALGREMSDLSRAVQPVKNGLNLHLSVSSKAQVKMYELLLEAVDEYEATGAVGIIQDVRTGELVTFVSVPSYDNNSFIGGISHNDYNKLLEDPTLPLLNRTISAQLPPGSTFKTLIAAGAIDSGAINENTVYVSRANYTFTNGARFQEYRGSSYGPLNINGAITMSSNIFFCEVIRNWDIDELVEYYDAFGIGKYTNIDLTGETPGRLPSPKNKIMLANTPGITWLDPIWYPEGDSCNTVIGQGITLVTPLQMSNWIATIANGGTLHNPHLGVRFTDQKDITHDISFEPLNRGFISDKALKVVRDGMRSAVAGNRRTIHALTSAKIDVAAKTGTAEFGAVDSRGIYQHTHAWVTGFFPYEEPKYSFVFLLEDGGESYYAAGVAKEFIDWWADNMQ